MVFLYPLGYLSDPEAAPLGPTGMDIPTVLGHNAEQVPGRSPRGTSGYKEVARRGGRLSAKICLILRNIESSEVYQWYY